MKKKRLVIIGAGLSGLYSAVLLQEQYDVTMIEARERTGGRIMTLDGHDLGPSWIWPHQKNILQLIETLGLELFPQYTKGSALYDTPEGLQRFMPAPSVPSLRMEGGLQKLTEALEKQLEKPVILESKVISLTYSNNRVRVQTAHESYEADLVISTLPPRLAKQNITYSPPLPTQIQTQFENIPTWMGYAAKCVVEYPHAFWREEGLSGFAFSHVGPLGEIHDASTGDKAALFGFLHSSAKEEKTEEQIIRQLIRLYGKQGAYFSTIYFVDWKKEIYSSSRLDARPLSQYPSYGYDASHFEGKLIFSGTESAFQEGGYLEGAVNAAAHVATLLKEG
jgi:monoamine oxidase